MTITPDELAAFADGELTGARHAEIERMAAEDPALAGAIERHRALRARLSAHYAPILDQPVPERLEAALGKGKVVDFAAAREKKAARVSPGRWAAILGPALAACLVLALFVTRSPLPDSPKAGDYAGAQLAGLLDDQLAAGQDPAASTRILISFRDETGDFCRAWTQQENAGIACKDERGWRLREIVGGASGEGGDYRQAGSRRVMALAQDMAAGPALDAAGEAAAHASGWR